MYDDNANLVLRPFQGRFQAPPKPLQEHFSDAIQRRFAGQSLQTPAPTSPAISAAMLDAWRAMAAAVADPSFELTVEEFAAIARAYERLRSRGATFDPMLAALLDCLRRQAAPTDDGLDDVAIGGVR